MEATKRVEKPASKKQGFSMQVMVYLREMFWATYAKILQRNLQFSLWIRVDSLPGDDAEEYTISTLFGLWI